MKVFQKLQYLEQQHILHLVLLFQNVLFNWKKKYTLKILHHFSGDISGEDPKTKADSCFALET